MGYCSSLSDLSPFHITLLRKHTIIFQVETANPEVTAWIVNLTTPKYLFPFELKPTNSVEADSYVTSIGFHGDNNVAIVWLNRLQNVYVIVTCRSQNNYNCSDVSMKRQWWLLKIKVVIF